MTPGRPCLLVVQHEDDCPPGMLGPWSAAAGIELDVLRAHDGRAVPAALVEHDGLVVLGGSMGATDDHHRWLLPTRALITQVVSAGMPFLGICLGHQLGAVALGGEVRPNPAGRTHGLRPWQPTEAGVDDPVLGGLAAGTAVLHWNDDVVVRVPDGATVLGVDADGAPQALRLGERAWSVQFHPEVTTEIVSRWDDGPDRPADLAALADLDAHLPALHEPWQTVLQGFAQQF